MLHDKLVRMLVKIKSMYKYHCEDRETQREGERERECMGACVRERGEKKEVYVIILKDKL